jgi:hypothetical protein
MSNWFRFAVQTITYAAFVGAVGYLSASPAYDYAAEEKATIKLSLSHAANRVTPCVRLTPEEIAKLAPNMRRPEKCERKRLPLTVELEIDDEVVSRIEAPPSGLWDDGPASVYERLEVLPGSHRITARLRDSDRPDGWDYVHSEEVTLAAGRYFTVTFRAETGGFAFR